MLNKGVKFIVALTSLYATVSLYGTLRIHGIEAPMVVGICTLYGFGFYSLIVLFIGELSK